MIFLLLIWTKINYNYTTHLKQSFLILNNFLALNISMLPHGAIKRKVKESIRTKTMQFVIPIKYQHKKSQIKMEVKGA